MPSQNLEFTKNQLAGSIEGRELMSLTWNEWKSSQETKRMSVQLNYACDRL